MNLLLDTHVWIWSQESPEELGSGTRAALVDSENAILVSTVSTLEMARMAALGRLSLTMDLRAWVDRSIEILQAATIALSHEMAIEAYRLPEPFHRDPADRLLVAAARTHAARIVTADDLILGYAHVQKLDART
jgi:PIN domain nuclease of toxin-antitoxin system